MKCAGSFGAILVGTDRATFGRSWRSMVRRWVPFVLVCCMAGSAAPAAAQFTSAVIPPPQPVRDTATAIPRADTARPPRRSQDSSTAATLSSMKAWVDSAAQALSTQTPAMGADTTSTGAAKARGQSTRPPARSARDTGATHAENDTGRVQRFRNGAAAPDTATALPLLTLLGLGAVVAGAVLRRR